ncbi:MAG TPA: two-component regulator propeller domain-containing protein, partial [Chryseolinea sp.]
MKGLKFRVILGFVLMGTLGALAQSQPRNLTKHWSIRDGLSQGVVNSISQDSQSLMWFATEDGINRFDGYSFKVFRYDPDNKTSIPDNFVQSVFKDSEGDFWVSSRKGLLAFDPHHETFSLYHHDFGDKANYTSNDVSFITEGSSGNLWIAWYGSGFASFDKEKNTFIPYTPESLPGLSSERTVAILEDKFGLLWVGTQEGGVNVFQVSQGAVVKKMNDLSSSSRLPLVNVHCFAQDKFGNVWIGTTQGLVVYNRIENKFFKFDDKKFAISSANVFSLFTDSNDNLWIGSQGEGLYQLDLRQFNTRTPDDFIFTSVKNLNDFDISKRTIQAIYEDKDKNIWIGTFGEGVYFISSVKENFVRIQKPIFKNTAVSFVPYYGMCYDRDGNLWLGTDGNGIYKSDFDGNTIRHFTSETNAGLTDNAILSALRDEKGRLWFGSYSQGLFLYDASADAFVNYQYKNARNKRGGNDVRVVFEDSKHNIWIGTNRGGLCLLNENEKTYSNPQYFSGALLNGDVRSITEDSNGNIWIGCYGDGVYSYSPATQEFKRHFNGPNGEDQLKSEVVFAIKADRKGNIWIGTRGGGLCVYHPGKNKFKRYTDKDGLSNNTINAILVDNNQNIWASTNAGISKYEVGTDKFFNYNVIDGLQEGQFNPGSALYNEVGGYMCMGGTLGLNIFY